MTQTQPPYAYDDQSAGRPPPPPVARKTNTTAVLALVFAFVVAPVGIVLGIVARRQIRRTGENGKGLATAGLVLGILFTLAGIAAVVLVVVLAAVLPKTLDTSSILPKLSSSTQDAAGVAPTDVRCPADVAAKAGTVFTCTAQLDGQPIQYTVTEQDDKGNVTFDSETFVPLTKVESLLQDQVAQQAGTPVTAKCTAGDKTVLVSVPDTTIDCTVANNADATDTLRYTATVKDTKGNLTFEQAP